MKNINRKENAITETVAFPILNKKFFGKRLVYLDNSATAQKPQAVIDAIIKFYETSNANIHRGIYFLAEKATMAYEQAREKVAELIGAEAEEIIFTSGTTQSLNMLAQMLGRNLNLGDEIILTIMEHHSNLLPWQELAREKKLVLKFIHLAATPFAKSYQLDMEKARDLITSKTKILAFTHISNTLGTINPIKELVKLAHQAGALTVVDAAQSVGHIPVNVKNLDCDFLAFSGHKIGGPTGIGVLYGKKELLKQLEPVFYGGGMVEDVIVDKDVGKRSTLESKSFFGKSKWLPSPQRFEAGTPNIAGAVGLAAAITVLNEIGVDRIEQQGKMLREYALEKLSKIKGLQIIGPQEEQAGAIISFTLENIHPHDVAEILDKEGIAVRAGMHCTIPLLKELNLEKGTIRISFYFYNSKDDIDALVVGIQKVKQVFH